MSTAVPLAAASRRAASTTIGWAEHTEVMPDGPALVPLACRETRARRPVSRPAWAPDLRASSWAKLEVPSIGPRTVTARAPLAFA